MKVLWQWRNDDVMRRETGIGQLIALRDVLWKVLQGWQNNVIQERKQASSIYRREVLGTGLGEVLAFSKW